MNKQTILEHYRTVEKEALMSIKPVESKPIPPGAFQCREHSPSYGTRRYTLNGPVDNYSDKDLLNYCEYTPEFGGRVERFLDGALVVVYTD